MKSLGILIFFILTEQNRYSHNCREKHTFVWCTAHHISYNLTYSLFSRMGFFGHVSFEWEIDLFFLLFILFL